MKNTRSVWILRGFIVSLVAVALNFQNCSQFKKSKVGESFQQSTSGSDSSVPNEPESNTPAGPTNTPYVCKPPRYYQHVIKPGEEKFLKCTPQTMDIVNFQVPDEGLALARAQLTFRNNHTQQIYYWNANVVVGNGMVSYAVGDDICPNQNTTKTILGYGHLSAKAFPLVKVFAMQGSSPCVDNQISVFSGGIVEVWVEDPHEECRGQDIGLVSTYDTLKDQTYSWTTSMTEILSLMVPSKTQRSKILVMGSVEGTPKDNPNRVCGQESATLVSQVTSNADGILDTHMDVIPASQGMGHLVLSPQKTVPYSPQLNSISLLVGSNTSLTEIFTGGCCGDAKLGFVKMK